MGKLFYTFDSMQYKVLRINSVQYPSVGTIKGTFNTDIDPTMDPTWKGPFYTLGHAKIEKIIIENQLDITYGTALFYGLEKVTTIEGFKYIGGGLKNCRKMFAGMKSLNQDIKLVNFRTSTCTDFSYMFSECGAAGISIDLNGMNTTIATTMSHMFDGCGASAINFIGSSSKSVVDSSYMFANCANLTEIKGDESLLRFEGVTLDTNMFADSPNLPNFDAGSIGKEKAIKKEDGGYFTLIPRPEVAVRTRIQLKHDIKENWLTYDPLPLEGETCYEMDTNLFKVGDGIHKYSELPYWNEIPEINVDSETLIVNSEGLVEAVVFKGAHIDFPPVTKPTTLDTVDANGIYLFTKPAEAVFQVGDVFEIESVTIPATINAGFRMIINTYMYPRWFKTFLSLDDDFTAYKGQTLNNLLMTITSKTDDQNGSCAIVKEKYHYDGARGIVPAPTTSEVGYFLNASGKWEPIPEIDVFRGATKTEKGEKGLVPQPWPNQRFKYLRGNGTWDFPHNTYNGEIYNDPADDVKVIDLYGVSELPADEYGIVYPGVTLHVRCYQEDKVHTAPLEIKINGQDKSIYWLNGAPVFRMPTEFTMTNIWGSWKIIDVTSPFKADETEDGFDGYDGLVPHPDSESRENFLRGDGTWAEIKVFEGIHDDPVTFNYDTGNVYVDGFLIGGTLVDPSASPLFFKKGDIIHYADVSIPTTITSDFRVTTSDQGGFWKMIMTISQETIESLRGNHYEDLYFRITSDPVETSQISCNGEMVSAIKVDGKKGLVPAPTTSEDGYFLNADGTWKEVDLSVFEGITTLEHDYDYTASVISVGADRIVLKNDEITSFKELPFAVKVENITFPDMSGGDGNIEILYSRDKIFNGDLYNKDDISGKHFDVALFTFTKAPIGDPNVTVTDISYKVDGKKGLVPAPTTSEDGYFLNANGNWEEVPVYTGIEPVHVNDNHEISVDVYQGYEQDKVEYYDYLAADNSTFGSGTWNIYVDDDRVTRSSDFHNKIIRIKNFPTISVADFCDVRISKPDGSAALSIGFENPTADAAKVSGKAFNNLLIKVIRQAGAEGGAVASVIGEAEVTPFVDGKRGLVPDSSEGDIDKFLHADGTWRQVSSNVFCGTSTSAASSAVKVITLSTSLPKTSDGKILEGTELNVVLDNEDDNHDDEVKLEVADVVSSIVWNNSGEGVKQLPTSFTAVYINGWRLTDVTSPFKSEKNETLEPTITVTSIRVDNRQLTINIAEGIENVKVGSILTVGDIIFPELVADDFRFQLRHGNRELNCYIDEKVVAARLTNRRYTNLMIEVTELIDTPATDFRCNFYEGPSKVIDTGYDGLVPKPAASEREYFLKGTGEWEEITTFKGLNVGWPNPDCTAEISTWTDTLLVLKTNLTTIDESAPISVEVDNFVPQSKWSVDNFNVLVCQKNNQFKKKFKFTAEQLDFIKSKTFEKIIFNVGAGENLLTICDVEIIAEPILLEGKEGLVPAPTTSEDGYFLNADGKWEPVSSNVFCGTSTSDASSAVKTITLTNSTSLPKTSDGKIVEGTELNVVLNNEDNAHDEAVKLEVANDVSTIVWNNSGESVKQLPRAFTAVYINGWRLVDVNTSFKSEKTETLVPTITTLSVDLVDRQLTINVPGFEDVKIGSIVTAGDVTFSDLVTDDFRFQLNDGGGGELNCHIDEDVVIARLNNRRYTNLMIEITELITGSDFKCNFYEGTSKVINVGYDGLVPKASNAEREYFLKGTGEWAEIDAFIGVTERYPEEYIKGISTSNGATADYLTIDVNSDYDFTVGDVYRFINTTFVTDKFSKFTLRDKNGDIIKHNYTSRFVYITNYNLVRNKTLENAYFVIDRITESVRDGNSAYAHYIENPELMDGKKGLVPAPTTSEDGYYLNADGTWKEVDLSVFKGLGQGWPEVDYTALEFDNLRSRIAAYIGTVDVDTTKTIKIACTNARFNGFTGTGYSLLQGYPSGGSSRTVKKFQFNDEQIALLKDKTFEKLILILGPGDAEELSSVEVITEEYQESKKGLVPAPTTSEAGYFLNASGNWEALPEVPVYTGVDPVHVDSEYKISVDTFIGYHTTEKASDYEGTVTSFTADMLDIAINSAVTVTIPYTVKLRNIDVPAGITSGNKAFTVRWVTGTWQTGTIDNVDEIAGKHFRTALLSAVVSGGKVVGTLTDAEIPVASTEGLVPVSTSSEEGYFLNADGTWKEVDLSVFKGIQEIWPETTNDSLGALATGNKVELIVSGDVDTSKETVVKVNNITFPANFRYEEFPSKVKDSGGNTKKEFWFTTTQIDEVKGKTFETLIFKIGAGQYDCTLELVDSADVIEGKKGLVPAPTTSEVGYFLNASGKWEAIPEAEKAGGAIHATHVQGRYRDDRFDNVYRVADDYINKELVDGMIINVDSLTIHESMTSTVYIYNIGYELLVDILDLPEFRGKSFEDSALIYHATTNKFEILSTTAAFRGSASSYDGHIGLVPQPAKGDQDKYLKGDGTWSNIPIWSGTQAQYDALGTYDDGRVYIIVG